MRGHGLFLKEICQMAKWVAAALGAGYDPNGRTDAGLRPRVRAATQTAQNGRSSASVWVARLKMPLGPDKHLWKK
jgi:hypothetical protein